jgi:hypothetical protein
MALASVCIRVRLPELAPGDRCAGSAFDITGDSARLRDEAVRFTVQFPSDGGSYCRARGREGAPQGLRGRHDFLEPLERRMLARLPLALPTSGGAVHVGFRVMPARAAAVRVMILRVRWHCVDHAFIIVRGATRVGRVSPFFDC